MTITVDINANGQIKAIEPLDPLSTWHRTDTFGLEFVHVAREINANQDCSHKLQNIEIEDRDSKSILQNVSVLSADSIQGSILCDERGIESLEKAFQIN